MINTSSLHISAAILLFLILSLFHDSLGQVSFNSSVLKSSDGKTLVIDNPTSLQFGPDGRLYVATQDGAIYAYTISRAGINDYKIIKTELINLVKNIPNHDDDGKLNLSVNSRQITGILVVGTASNPVIYAGSSDPRIGGGGTGADKNLDTNSGIISRLTWTGTKWEKVDLVRGLPRSEENHANNGMQLDEVKKILYVAQGGHTNAGAPSNNFAFQTEYALSAAILSIDLKVIDALPMKTDAQGQKYMYDLPTVDDPTRPNNPDGSDPGDPFGGNDGLNQAKLLPNGPVQIYSPGYRNIYDLVITKTPGREGRMYTIDNGANGGWGGHPANEGSHGKVTNNYIVGEPGSTGPGPNDDKVNNLDNLHFVTKGYYAGHPTPIRANPAGAGLYTYDTKGVWRTSKTDPVNPLPADWPPVPISMANPVEGDFRNPGVNDGALYLWEKSTNGIAEYAASNFNNALKGNLLATSWDGKIYSIALNQAGNKVNAVTAIASGINNPLDVTAQGDQDVFPGTIWSADYGAKTITILEPNDFINCTGIYDKKLDDDKDGYTNADEVDNQTDPCSPASRPPDNDMDFISDLNDPDDDNDGILDTKDFFAIDAYNGLNTYLPIDYSLLNNDPGTGFFGLGFTGLMANGTSDYLNVYNEKILIAGGAVGAFTIDGVTSGDAFKSFNNQENAFQFGVNVKSSTGSFTVDTKMLSPFFNSKKPVDHQSQGVYIGVGDQDNYLKLVLASNGGNGGLEVVFESEGVIKVQTMYASNKTGALNIPDNVLSATTLNLLLSVDPIKGTVQPQYQINEGTVKILGDPIQLEGKLLTAIQGSPAMAVGLIATSRGSNLPFTATWDHISVKLDAVESVGKWNTLATATNPEARHENAFVQVGDKFYLLGGRGIKNTNIYDTKTGSWSNGAKPPVEMHHFQAIAYHGLLYVVGAFTGAYPNETPLKNIYIYNPLKNTWTVGPEIPVARRRGSAAAVVYNDKIYLIGGITKGHTSGHVKWMDEFDPSTNTWKILSDAPRARDHFHAAVAGTKVYAIAGRNTKSAENVFANTIAEVDVYDFQSGVWSTLPSQGNIPTLRAGAGVAVLGSEILVMGGESASQVAAHNETESLSTNSHTWRKLAPMKQGRHGTQAIVSNDGIYISAGNANRGGNAELNTLEAFHFFNTTNPGGTATSSGTLNVVPFLDFGKIQLNTNYKKTVKLSNKGGNQAILVTGIAISGGNGYTVKNPYTLPVIIKPGDSFDVEVNVVASSSGKKTANLQISHSGGQTLVALTAEAVQDAVLQLNTESIHFLSQAALTHSPPQEIVITNKGSTAVGIEKVSLAGSNAAEFKHDFTSKVTLQPSGSLKINVSFTPASMGMKTAQMAIEPTGGASPLMVNLSGEGISAEISEVRINAGGEAFTTTNGLAFIADQYFLGGKAYTNPKVTKIEGTADDKLYLTERSATSNLESFSYNIPVHNGKYLVRLHFAEIYWGAAGGGAGGVNKRVFSVNIEGGPVELLNFDIFAEVGAMKAVVKQYQVTVNDGVLNIEFSSTVDQAKVSAIEIMPVSDSNNPPVVANTISDQKATIGQLFSFTFPENIFTDPDGDALSYAASLSDNGPLPSWLSFHAGTRTFSGTPPAGSAGSKEIKVAATDTKQASVSTTFKLTIGNPVIVNNPPAVAHAIPNQNATVGELFEFTFSEDIFTDPDGDALTYAASLFDNKPLPSWLSFNAGTRTFSGTPSAGSAGLLEIQVTAIDTEQASVSTIFQLKIENPVIVNNPPVVAHAIPNQNATVGELFEFTFSENIFTDPDGDALTYAASLFDNKPLPSWLSFNAGTRTFSGTPSAGSAGLLEIQVTAIDTEQASVSTIFQLKIENPVIENNPPVVANTIPDQNATVGELFEFTFAEDTFTDPDGDALTYTASLSDNKPLPSWLSFHATTRTFSGTPPAGSAGSLEIKVTANDTEQASVSAMFQLTIENSGSVNNPPAVANPIPDQNAVVGELFDFTFDEDTFTDTDKDPLSFSVSLADGQALPQWLSFDAEARKISGTPPAGSTGEIEIKVTATNTEQVSVSTVFVIAISENTSIKIVNFTLINADSNHDIGIINDNDIINLAELPTKNLNIRANTYPDVVGSVQFDLNQVENYHTQNAAPYAMAGHDNGNYLPWVPEAGNFTLKAIPFSGADRSGFSGVPLTINFNIIEEGPLGLIEDRDSELIIYPNPFDDVIYFEYAGDREVVQIVIFDGTGRNYWENSWDLYKGKFTIDLKGEITLPGIYFIKFSSKESSKVFKLLKH